MVCRDRVGRHRDYYTHDHTKHVYQSPPGKIWEVVADIGYDGADEGN